jgi:hypothetical protein
VGIGTTSGRVAPVRNGLVDYWRAPESGTAAQVTAGFGGEPNLATPIRCGWRREPDGGPGDRVRVGEAVRPGSGTARQRHGSRCRPPLRSATLEDTASGASVQNARALEDAPAGPGLRIAASVGAA